MGYVKKNYENLKSKDLFQMSSATIARSRTSQQISKLLEKLVLVLLNASLSLIGTLPPVQSEYGMEQLSIVFCLTR